MPFYKIKQRGVVKFRLVEAEKPQGAINHVVADLFTWEKVDGRALLDAAAVCEVEVAGAPVEDKIEPQEETLVTDGDEVVKKPDLDVDRLRDDKAELLRLAAEESGEPIRKTPERFGADEDEFGKID